MTALCALDYRLLPGGTGSAGHIGPPTRQSGEVPDGGTTGTGKEAASSRAVGKNLRARRTRERAESWLATDQVPLGRLFIFDRIATDRLNCRQ